jgi:hypothetical protein
MSQFYVGIVSSGGLPGNVPTSFVTDIGTVIPASNVVNINGGETTTNNNNGIQVIANPTGSNNEVVQLTNRITATGVTTDGTTPVTLFTFPLGVTPGVYVFTNQLAIFDKTDSLGSGFVSYFTVRTTGAAATLLGYDTPLNIEEGALDALGVENNISIAGNSFSIIVTGLAGKTIDYFALTTYIFVS